MLYTPIPGTPLHAELTAKGQMKDPATFEQGDIHGQLVFNYRHPHIPAGMESRVHGAGLRSRFRAQRAEHVADRPHDAGRLEALQNHPDARVRRRFAWEARELATTFSAATAGAKMYYRRNPAMRAKMAALLKELNEEFGWKSRLMSHRPVAEAGMKPEWKPILRISSGTGRARCGLSARRWPAGGAAETTRTPTCAAAPEAVLWGNSCPISSRGRCRRRSQLLLPA